jgi:hypothetical protein
VAGTMRQVTQNLYDSPTLHLVTGLQPTGLTLWHLQRHKFSHDHSARKAVTDRQFSAACTCDQLLGVIHHALTVELRYVI